MLTSRGRRTIALGLIAGLFGRLLGIPELFGLAAAAVVVTLAAVVRVRLTRRAITLSARAVPQIVSLGEAAHVEITVEEARAIGPFSTTVVLEADDSQSFGSRQPAEIAVPRVGPSGLAHATFELSTLRRGFVTAGAYEAVVTDQLGLARRSLGASRAVTCVVLPRVEPLATVTPNCLGWDRAESTRSAAERLISGSSTVRRYAQGDDLRRVHWRTTARVGELMVREGGDREDPDRMATTVLLDAGGEATPPAELDRAVEVAASILAAAADASSARASGAYRLVTTTGLDTDAQWGRNGLQTALVALAGVGPSPVPAPERLRDAVGRLRRPGEDEVLVVVGAFGESPPDPLVIRDASRAYAAVVVVMVGAEVPTPSAPGAARQLDAERTGPRSALEISSSPDGSLPGSSCGPVLTVRLPRGASLASAWSLELADLRNDSFGQFTDRSDYAAEPGR